jgi:hypothetical protein
MRPIGEPLEVILAVGLAADVLAGAVFVGHVDAGREVEHAMIGHGVEFARHPGLAAPFRPFGGELRIGLRDAVVVHRDHVAILPGGAEDLFQVQRVVALDHIGRLRIKPRAADEVIGICRAHRASHD